MAKPRPNPSMPRHWREWYQLEVWRRKRRTWLAMHPLCAECERQGRVTAACVVDHVTPHGGDWNRFLLDPVQSLCRECHDRKTACDHRGVEVFGRGCDEQGMPLDRRHPAYNR